MLKIVLLILAVSTDGFAAAIGLGSAGIKIPLKSAAIISLTGTLFLTVSVCLANVLCGWIPYNLCHIISSSLLILIGILNLFHGFFKKISAKLPARAKKNSPIAMFFDGTQADTDNSKTISCKEALVFSVVLSADSIVTGVSAGLGNIMLLPLIIAAFLIGLGAILAGSAIGKRVIFTGSLNLQWLCGIALIIIALLQ